MAGLPARLRARRLRTLVAPLLLAAAPAFAAGDPAAPRHVLYLHGRIVQEQQNPRPYHAEFGYYELEQILAAFKERGFEASGPVRPREATVSQAADEVVSRVRALLLSGTPADRITVVGASMGGGIALTAAARLKAPQVRFCVLGVCLSQNVKRLTAEEGHEPRGRVLAIREKSDELTAECPPWPATSPATGPLVAREIVVDTGFHHGFLYRPIPEWLDPVVAWATHGPGRGRPD
jgi:pimeloyl-ACP methyl ester carboxylesterase